VSDNDCRVTTEGLCSRIVVENDDIKYLKLNIKMAEVHGNRTHPGRYQRPTPDLKGFRVFSISVASFGCLQL
jgi:hypothetical protein